MCPETVPGLRLELFDHGVMDAASHSSRMRQDAAGKSDSHDPNSKEGLEDVETAHSASRSLTRGLNRLSS